MRTAPTLCIILALFIGCVSSPPGKESSHRQTLSGMPSGGVYFDGKGMAFYKEYPIKILSEPPGVNVDWDNEFIGKTPLDYLFTGWRQVKFESEVKAYPPEGYTNSEGFKGPEEKEVGYRLQLPKKIMFQFREDPNRRTLKQSGKIFQQQTFPEKTQDAESQENINLTGNWAGYWNSSDHWETGSLRVSFIQAGNLFTGEAIAGNSNCNQQADFHGAINGGALSFTAISKNTNQQKNVTVVTGRVTGLSEIKGNFKTIEGPCKGGHGDFELIRQK